MFFIFRVMCILQMGGDEHPSLFYGLVTESALKVDSDMVRHWCLLVTQYLYSVSPFPKRSRQWKKWKMLLLRRISCSEEDGEETINRRRPIGSSVYCFEIYYISIAFFP